MHKKIERCIETHKSQAYAAQQEIFQGKRGF